MDCNNYSYAPSMLDCEENTIAHYENDDMSMELVRYDNRVFCVSAFSYDGSLDVSEEYYSFAKAAKLYRFLSAYRSTPPGDELGEFINSLRSAVLPTARVNDEYITFCHDGRSTSYSRSYCWTEKSAWKDFWRTIRLHKETDGFDLPF